MSVSNQTDEERLNQEFRRAMRRHAATVTVVSAALEGEPYGITATAVASLSIDPASLVVCINRNASVHEPIVQSGSFCVNLLCDSHLPVAQAFGGKQDARERFATGDWAKGALELPYLRDAQASIFCKLEASTVYASHSIFVGRVTAVRVRDEITPLLYHDGQYSAAVNLAS